jgi:hypothetical protein
MHPQHSDPGSVGQLLQSAGRCVPVHRDAVRVAQDRPGVATVDGPVDRSSNRRR